jgi:hypothetical protein
MRPFSFRERAGMRELIRPFSELIYSHPALPPPERAFS